MTSIRGFLEEFSRWLDHGETAAGLGEEGVSQERKLGFARDVASTAVPVLSELFEHFEDEARLVEEPQLPIHKSFARREIHPLIMCSPFAHRSYTKPLGYAGDYEMVNMMLREPWEGSNTYAKVLNAFFLQADTARAHRFRIDRLTSQLETEVRRVAARQRPCRVMTVGCGPCVEVQRFIARSEWADNVDLVAVDFNQETLDHARTCIQTTRQSVRRQPRINFQHLSVHELLKRVSKRGMPVTPAYDYIYCAGLFDYLNDRVCSRLLQLFYDSVLPGGLVLVTNVHPRHPVRGLLEHVQEWYLLLRDERQMRQLAPELGIQRVSVEQTGVNVFLEIRKPADEV